MAGFHAASDYTKSAFFVTIFGGLLLIFSYSFPYWTTNHSGMAGLWKGCNDGDCYERYNQWNEPWLRSAQAFMTLALVTWFACLVVIFAYMFARYFDEDKRMVFLAVICAALTTLFTLVGVLIWSACQHLGNGEILNWAYAFSWGHALCMGFVTFFMVMELRTPVNL